MLAPESLQTQQFQLAAHIRDPEHVAPPPDIEPRRVAVYAELFFNNVEGLLAANFPVINQLFGEDRWRRLIRDFYRDYRCSTPLFPEVPRELIRYLDNIPLPEDAPWLRELAHYEWIELALHIADDEIPPHDPHGDLLDGVPVASPFVRALAYAWPVHRIAPDYRPQTAPEAAPLLLVRRDADGEVRFAEISPLVYRLLERMGDESPATGRDLLGALAHEAGAVDIDVFVRDGAAMLQQLHQQGVILGTQPL